MSHTTQVTITTSNNVTLELITGTRELAELYNVDAGNSLELKAELAAAILVDPKFLKNFPPLERVLITTLYNIEDCWEDEHNPEIISKGKVPSFVPKGFRSEPRFEHLSIKIHHCD